MFDVYKKTIISSEKISETDLHNEMLQALLTEYSCLRAEVQHDHGQYTQLVTITVSVIIALVSATIALRKEAEIVSFILFVLLPCFIMIMGLLWIDSIYRRVRSTCYTKILENKINNLLHGNNLDGERIMEWMYWIERSEDGKGRGTSNRTFRSWIVALGCLAAPFFSILLSFLLAGKPFLDEFTVILELCRTHCPATLFMMVLYIVYFIFFCGYLKVIKTYSNKAP